MHKGKKCVNVVAFYISVASERHKRWNIDTAQVPDVVCHDLAEDIGKDWKMLGRQLHIFESHLDNIDRQDHYVREKSISMLNKWRENVGKKATGKVLTETLEEIGRKDLSEKVRGMNISSLVYPCNSSSFSRKLMQLL